MKYVIGIDLGTSGTKTVLFDELGNTVASHTVEYPMYQPQNGWAEQDPADWWNATVTTVKAVVTESGVSNNDIVGIGISGQMHGLVMLDKDNQVIRNSIIWCDQRTAEECEDIERLVGRERLIQITANPALTGFTASKIMWVKKHEPENYAKCRHILLPKDYVRATGGISAGVASDDDAWKVPENQCLREIECELTVMPQWGDNLAEKAMFEAKAFQNPLMAQCEPVDTHKFMGGRPAVQDTAIAEFFYQDLEYADVKLERKGCEFFLEGQGLQVTAFKKAHDRTGHILRFFNIKDQSVDAVLHLGKLPIAKVWKTNLKETAREEMVIKNNIVKLRVRAKEIVTLFLG